VVLGTIERYAKQYPGVSFVFNPEFLTEINYLEDFVTAERIVIGSNNDWATQTINMLYKSVPCFQYTPVLKMSSTAAEIVKYYCNILLATKVTIANIMYDVCKKFDVSYGDVKDAVSMDPRIGNSHLSVTSERGWGGKCFPKDLGAFIGRCRELGVDIKVLEEIFTYNSRTRKVKDWREIAGATVGGRDYTKKGE
jgi:UDPglucose 6-dehydrogenase